MEVRSEWTRPVPDGWEDRLRQFSPIVDQTSHLRFRWRAEEERWMLYACTPAALLDDFRNEQLRVHWSALPPSQQMGRKQYVSEYQHYMYREFGLEARPFWVLQGPVGGTPAVYSHREQRLLKAVGAPDDPPPIGFLPPCPFDERAVEAIVERDLLAKIGGDLDLLAASQSGKAMASEDEETERAYRRAFLDWWSDTCIPMSEFMQGYLRSSDADHTLRRATRAENNAVAQWKEHFLETGEVIDAAQAQSSSLIVPVALSLT